MIRLFLDTEWADPAGQQLVSQALVSEGRVHKLYIERHPLPRPESDFVERVVYPLLERGRSAMPDQELAARVRTFLAAGVAPEVVADHSNDFELRRRVVAQASSPMECGPPRFS